MAMLLGMLLFVIGNIDFSIMFFGIHNFSIYFNFLFFTIELKFHLKAQQQ